MTHNIFGELDTRQFIAQHWQSKPLLIRQAIKDFQPELTADTLAGLALEDHIRSRIVLEHREESEWECRFGPFEESDFTTLPESHWTLLVQDVEKHLPQYASLLDYFSFLPRWRVDDLMVSYAVDGGSVGPHTDNYDVFLLQAQGQRQWHIQTEGVQVNELLADTDLRILKNFHADHCWTLDPGDMLYLPPGVAHHGIAIGDCMTFSIGFRAPSQIDLLQAFTDQVSSNSESEKFYTDQADSDSSRRGELGQQSLQHFREMLRESLNNDKAITQAVASLLTESVETPAWYQTDDWSLETFTNNLAITSTVKLHPAIRSFYIQKNGAVYWHVHGEVLEIKNNAAAALMQLIDDYRLASGLIRSLLEDHDLIQMLYIIYQDGGLHIDL